MLFDNLLLAAFFQRKGCNVVANVIWARPIFYNITFSGQPIGGTICVSSNSLDIRDKKGLQHWLHGYAEADKRLSPEQVIRIGKVIPGEEEIYANPIRIEVINPYVEKMRHGGGNGARAAFLAGLLDKYGGPRFDEIGRIGDVKVIKVWTQNSTKVPVESFNSNMYYVANPRTGEIEHIAFYDKNGNVKHSIDLYFNKDGSSAPYREFMRKGRLRSEGSHFHREWPVAENGDKGRIPHAEMNCEPVNKYYMRFVNKAIEYNAKIRKNNGK